MPTPPTRHVAKAPRPPIASPPKPPFPSTTQGLAELNVCKLGDYGVPYGYSPVLLAQGSALGDEGRRAALRRALAAIARCVPVVELAVTMYKGLDCVEHTRPSGPGGLECE